MNEQINWNFLKIYIPGSELAALRQNVNGEEGAFFIELLQSVERQIKSVPTLYATGNLNAEHIRIGMHYFGGSTDVWLYELDQETLEGTAFVCLNGDWHSAESGPVYLPEIVWARFIELDLYWDTGTTLKEVMDLRGTQ